MGKTRRTKGNGKILNNFPYSRKNNRKSEPIKGKTQTAEKGHPFILYILAGFGLIAAIPGMLVLTIAGASAGTAFFEAAKTKIRKKKKGKE